MYRSCFMALRSGRGCRQRGHGPGCIPISCPREGRGCCSPAPCHPCHTPPQPQELMAAPLPTEEPRSSITSVQAGGQGLGRGVIATVFCAGEEGGSPGSAQPEEPLLTFPCWATSARSHSAPETLWLPILCPHIHSLTPPCMIFPDSDWN